MAYQLMGSGGIVDVGQFGNLESYLGEGDRGLVELDLRLPVSQGVAQSLEGKLRDRGIEGVRVSTASPMLRIYFTKGFPWLAVIAAVILAAITLAILIIGWRIYKEVVPEGLQPIVGAIGSIGLLLLIGLGVVLLIRRR